MLLSSVCTVDLRLFALSEWEKNEMENRVNKIRLKLFMDPLFLEAQRVKPVQAGVNLFRRGETGYLAISHYKTLV